MLLSAGRLRVGLPAMGYRHVTRNTARLEIYPLMLVGLGHQYRQHYRTLVKKDQFRQSYNVPRSRYKYHPRKEKTQLSQSKIRLGRSAECGNDTVATL